MLIDAVPQAARYIGTSRLKLFHKRLPPGTGTPQEARVATTWVRPDGKGEKPSDKMHALARTRSNSAAVNGGVSLGTEHRYTLPVSMRSSSRKRGWRSTTMLAGTGTLMKTSSASATTDGGRAWSRKLPN